MQYSFVTVASALVATVSASAISTIADGQPQAPSYEAAQPTPTPSPSYHPAPPAEETTTEHVTHLTTVCPSGTHTYGSHTVTATKESTVTISDCYCDVVKPVPTHPAPVYSAPPAVPTKEAPAVPETHPAPAPAPSSSAPVSQIEDNQVQAPTKAAPSAEVPAASAPASSAPVSQIEDNQVQAPTKAAPSAEVPAASAPASVSQIEDNQVQAPTSAASVPAASVPAASVPAASAPAETPAATPTPPVYTAGAANVAASGFSFAAVLAAVAYVL